MESETLMTVRQAAAEAGVSRQAILAAMACGKLRGQREGEGTRADVLIDRADFVAWQAQRSGLKRGPKGPRVPLFGQDVALCGGAKEQTPDVREFASWDDAWVYCRGEEKPVIAKIDGQVYRLYPDGSFERELTHVLE